MSKRVRSKRGAAGWLMAAALLVNAAAVNAEMDRKAFVLPDEVPAPADNKVTPERVELGKMLYFDPRLSASNWISCATCHNPGLGWSDGLPTAIGHGMQVLERATPTILNSAYNNLQMWDGRFRTLEAQALGPIEAAGEMSASLDVVVSKLKTIPGYVAAFEKAYPGEGVSKDTIAKAIASYERTIVSKDSPFDRWVKGEESAMNESAKRGFALFTGKANCAACHMGGNFTDDGFHNLGLKGNQDAGRFAKVPLPSMKGAFKTPTLRDVALTAPYMHNGVYRSLDEVVDHYNRGGDYEEGQKQDPNMRPLNLSAQEKKDVVEFLKHLTGKQVQVVLPTLPQ